MYGRKVPKHAHGTYNLKHHTSSTRQIMEGAMELYERIVDEKLLVRRVNITVNNVIDEKFAVENKNFEQLDLFTDYEALEKEKEKEKKELEKERYIQEAIIEIKKKYGKNAVLKGLNLEEGATTKDRNSQIGGHKA